VAYWESDLDERMPLLERYVRVWETFRLGDTINGIDSEVAVWISVAESRV
jgi:hypothetical protein